MKCLILAAGYATRLYPLTENFPKPLLKVKGKKILDWLIGYGVREIISSGTCGCLDYVVMFVISVIMLFMDLREENR